MPAAGSRAAAVGTRSDPAVTQAGGAHAGPCGHCRRSACPQCRLPGEGHGSVHGPCHHGLCPAHCPVRPDVFGFYGTQWRKWPGAGVIQASNQDEATPARPPKAEVPEAAEESLQQPSDEQSPPGPAAAGPAAEDPLDQREDAAPADRGKAGGKPAPAPLPRPFPDVDDGAADGRRPGRRTSRIIFLEKDPEEQADDDAGSRFAARLVTITEIEDDARDAGDARDAPRPVARVGGDEPGSSNEPDPRPSTPWRRFLSPVDGDQAAVNGP
jgi:hypothetical protein